MENPSKNTNQSANTQEDEHTLDCKKSAAASPKRPVKTTTAEDLIDDIKKDKIDPLTEGETNLGYEEKPPRKKELEQKEHLDQQEES